MCIYVCVCRCMHVHVDSFWFVALSSSKPVRRLRLVCCLASSGLATALGVRPGGLPNRPGKCHPQTLPPRRQARQEGCTEPRAIAEDMVQPRPGQGSLPAHSGARYSGCLSRKYVLQFSTCNNQNKDMCSFHIFMLECIGLPLPPVYIYVQLSICTIYKYVYMNM